MRIKIAVICDDQEVIESLRKELSSFYFELSADAKDGEDVDLAVVDLRDPDNPMPAPQIPYIAILSRAVDFPRLKAAGANDFVLYPFMEGDLAFRVWLTYEKPLNVGLMIDLDNYEVIADGKVVYLTFKEFELLRFLVKSKGRVVSRSTLLAEVWDRDYAEGNRTVDVHVRRLRAKLGIKYGDLVETVRNVGYRFRDGAEVRIEGDRSFPKGAEHSATM